MGKIRIILFVLLLCSTVTAGNYDKDIRLNVAGVATDSVVLIVEVNNVEIDSILWKVFPVDSFVTLNDTAIVTLSWFWFYEDNRSESPPYTTAWEQIDQAIRMQSVYNNPFGWYVVDTITGDSLSFVTTSLTDEAGRTWENYLANSDGLATAQLVTGNWTFSSTQRRASFRDTTINVTGPDTILVRGGILAVATPPSADLSNVFGFVTDMGDNPLEGIVAQASFSDAAARGDSGTTGVIISAAVLLEDPTDSLGLFELFLKRTGTYPDTSKAFYDIRGYQDEVLMFEILQVYVPAAGNVDLGNILGAREP